jgi:hypothetical protein
MAALIYTLALVGPGHDVAPDVPVEAKCCGRSALSLVARYLEVGDPGPSWESALPSEQAPFALSQLELAAKEAGFDAASVNWPDPSLADLTIPCVLHVKPPGGPDHFLACFGCRGDAVLISDYPALPRFIPRAALLRIWSGTALYLGRPGSSDLSRLRWQARKAYIGPLLWAALGGGLATFAWLTWRQHQARRRTEAIPPAIEVTSA